MLKSDEFVLSQDVRVPSARDPKSELTIPGGTWNVIWEDTVSVVGRAAGTECTVVTSAGGHPLEL
jgi:hypothetical protein